MGNINKPDYDYENSLGFLIYKTGKLLIQVFDQELRKNFDITFSQWKIIITLVNNSDGLTQKEIADKLGLEGPTLIPIIDKLEKDGFAIRKVCNNDRRNNRIFLTEKTNNELELMINSAIKIRNKSLHDISEENITVTKDTLEKMLINIQKISDNNGIKDKENISLIMK
ncbi:MAG TPA: MarR family transcriptional regulator [Verrucomicrobiae bacterium]|nr:MarR family transcriptional regulator [Verrucomicrobiae bacterium]